MHFITHLAGISIKANDVGLPTSTTTIAQGLANIVNLLMTVVGAVAVLMLIVGGLMYAASTGDPARIKTAQQTMTNAVVGLAIAIIALAIVNFVAFALR